MKPFKKLASRNWSSCVYSDHYLSHLLSTQEIPLVLGYGFSSKEGYKDLIRVKLHGLKGGGHFAKNKEGIDEFSIQIC